MSDSHADPDNNISQEINQDVATMSGDISSLEHEQVVDSEESVGSKAVLVPEDIKSGALEHKQNTVQESVVDDAQLASPKQRIDADLETTSTSDEAKRREIEDQAIRHLARRASEMSLSTSTTQTPPTIHRDAKLPATPPPPPPPEKEKSKMEVVDEKSGMEDTAVLDLPNAPHGSQEQAGEEIQHIMEQFEEGTAPGEEEIMSPRLERQQPILQLPPRSSSLETGERYIKSPTESSQDTYFPTNPKRASIASQAIVDDSSSIRSHRTNIFQPPPPSPEPETALPFDFHRFLEQLRHRTADPVARFLRSFLQEFGKKQWMAHEQVKIIGDFLEFIAKKMSQCEVWRTVSDAEFDNAREGMEKLVMNRLYTQTFSPAIAPPAGSPRKGTKVRDSGPSTGRRGQHQEDVERDEVIAQKMRIYGWLKEDHLDIKPIGDKGKKFLTMAQQELLKINTYRAPRDKVICVLNCCKVIFGFLKNSKGDQSADSFVPLLIYTVLQARPEHLVSNVQYIWRFRNQDKLGGEAGYYMSSLMGVLQFVENLDRTMITISDEEFESHVEQAVSAIAEGHKSEQYEEKTHDSTARPATQISEKGTISRPEVTVRNSATVQQSSPRRQRSTAGIVDDDDTDAMTGLLRSIQKPLSSIGRIFSDDTNHNTDNLRPSSTPLPPRTSSRALSPVAQGARSTSQGRRSTELRSERHASNLTAEAQRERERGYGVVVETLQGMFPNLDKDVIEDVVRAQDGNVGRAVDACLALSDQG